MCYRLPNGGLSVVFANFERIFYDASRAFQARYATIEVLRTKVILKDKDCILLWSYWIISSYLAQSTHRLSLQLIPRLFPTIFEIIGAAQDLIMASFASVFPPRNWNLPKKLNYIHKNRSAFYTLGISPLLYLLNSCFHSWLNYYSSLAWQRSKRCCTFPPQSINLSHRRTRVRAQCGQ